MVRSQITQQIARQIITVNHRFGATETLSHFEPRAIISDTQAVV